MKCYAHWLDTILPALAVTRVSQLCIPGIVVSMVDQNSTMAFGGDYSRREMKLISRAYST